MKSLLLSALVCLSAVHDSANAITITVDRETYPSALEFTVTWGPSPPPNVFVLAPEPIWSDFFFLIEADTLSGYWSTPPPRPYVNVDLWLMHALSPTTSIIEGMFTVNFLFPSGAAPLFSLATPHINTLSHLPAPTISPTPDGYGARFLFQSFPLQIPDGGSSGGLLILGIVTCFGLSCFQRRPRVAQCPSPERCQAVLFRSAAQ